MNENLVQTIWLVMEELESEAAVPKYRIHGIFKWEGPANNYTEARGYEVQEIALDYFDDYPPIELHPERFYTVLKDRKGRRRLKFSR